jgi:transcriptional regulator GlxA family with amidase domain
MKNAAVLVFPDVEELDFVGPWEMLTMWREVANGPAEVALLAASLAPVRCSKGLSVNPSLAMVDAPQLDLLVVPGGKGTRSLQHDGQVLDFIQRQHAGGAVLVSVCTGSLLLHAAGVIANDQPLATHWGAIALMRERGAEVSETRWVRASERVWCSAGVSAGLDVTLAVIAELAGEEAAGRVQHMAEYYPDGRRYGRLHAEHPQSPAYLKA